MKIRYPTPLQPGDRIGVTAPSSGVAQDLRPRFDFCVEHLKRAGYDVVVGDCMDGAGAVSAPARERAAELTGMLTDPTIRAVVPPWGGELAVEVLPHLDFARIALSAPTWLVGYSDLSTLLLPLTTITGIATLHGQNLMDTPYGLPESLTSWLEAVSLPTGTSFSQSAVSHHRGPGFDRWQDDPRITEFTLDEPGSWSLLDPAEGDLHATGRLIGGCIETVSILAGTAYGDLHSFATDYASEGLIVYVEAAESPAFTIARDLWRMRLAGWFDEANAVLVGRTHARDEHGFNQRDAVRSALGDTEIPVVLDVECGHVAPQLALINGALTELTVSGPIKSLTQRLT